MATNYALDRPDELDAHSIPIDNPLRGAPPARFADGEVLRRTSSSTATGRWPAAGSFMANPSGWPRSLGSAVGISSSERFAGMASRPSLGRFLLPVLQHFESFCWRADFSLRAARSSMTTLPTRVEVGDASAHPAPAGLREKSPADHRSDRPGRPCDERCRPQTRSNRSSSMTLVQAAAKSVANFCCASLLA